MAKQAANLRLVPSLWERLEDRQPGLSQETPRERFFDVADVKYSVAGDLETLLNTRCESDVTLLPELQHSLLAYGFPELSAFSLHSARDRDRLGILLRKTIEYFEPRLRGVRVIIDPPGKNERSLHFRIEALLRLQPLPEPVVFRAELDLAVEQYKIEQAHVH